MMLPKSVMMPTVRLLVRSITIGAAAALSASGWYRYHGQPAKAKPVTVQYEQLHEENTASQSSTNLLCGKRLHLGGTVTSQVTPESYAIVDHADGDITHVTNVRKAQNSSLPLAGDRVDIWGIVDCEGPRYHVNETRRDVTVAAR